MTRLLLDDRFAPITSEIGFLEHDAEALVARYLEWQAWIERQDLMSLLEGVESSEGPEAPPPRPRLPPGEPVYDVETIGGGLENALQALLPLTTGEATRLLFVPTAGPWTAYLDNGSSGTDAFPPMSYLAKELETRGLRVVAVPPGQGRYAASIFELYGTRQTEWLNVERAISALEDGDRWRFDTVGDPLPFEDVEQYGARRMRDRFPHELLDRYLRELGVEVFNEAFYAPEGRSFLLTSRRPGLRDVEEKTLEQARAGLDAPPSTTLRSGPKTTLERIRTLFRR